MRGRKSNEVDMTVDRSWREDQREDARRWRKDWERDKAGVVVVDKPTHEVKPDADGE